MKFKDLHISNEIKTQLDKLGFVRPTDIQFKAIPPILKGEDVFAVAFTGTGKTAAFVIPIVHAIFQRKKRDHVSALVLVPTRELAQQITNVFNEIAAHTNVKTVCLHGGSDQDPQIKQLKEHADVVVASPGRMFDLIAQQKLDVSHIQHFVLDEADLMLDKGFKKDIQDIIQKIPKKRQTLFFSATITKKIKSFAYDIVRDAIRIQISPRNPVAKTIQHAVAFIEMDDKRFFLENVIKEYPDFRFVVFVRTKVRAERVKAALKRVDIDSEFLHGGLGQDERFAVLNRFRSKETNVLITTDVAARGIDIPDVDYVLNYDIPDVPENYVHRCGRTGRGGKKGLAMSFCSTEEKPLLTEIESYTGQEIEQYELSKGDYASIVFDSDEGGTNWQKLIADANKEFNEEDEWD